MSWDILCIGGGCAGSIYWWDNGLPRHGMLIQLWRPERDSAGGAIPHWGPVPEEETADVHIYRVVQMQCDNRKWFVAVPKGAADTYAMSWLINHYANSHSDSDTRPQDGDGETRLHSRVARAEGIAQEGSQ